MRLKFLYTLIFICGMSAWASSNVSAGHCRKIIPSVQPARGNTADKTLMSEYTPFLRALYI